MSDKEKIMAETDNKAASPVTGSTGGGSTELRIKNMYGDMGRAEKRLADWLFANFTGSVGLSISELAGRSGVSEATVVRFARRLGFEGYKELKISMAQDVASAPARASRIHESVTVGDDVKQITKKVFDGILSTLEYTGKVLDYDQLDAAGEAILAAANGGKIVVCGLGASASIAQDAAHKFMREGLNAISACDNHLQAIRASMLKPGDVLIAVSHSGSSRDIVETARLAHERGATVICITNYSRSRLVAESDIVLFTASDETRYRKLSLSSRIASLAIIDTLYLYVAVRLDPGALECITRAEEALESKKY
ncbi:MAG: MurR/RpiR family transcriptional regulator [Clostridiales bacterium]|nr:MurR/RpiR family transcriptional regulator [Clostridiales bacterium]